MDGHGQVEAIEEQHLVEGHSEETSEDEDEPIFLLDLSVVGRTSKGGEPEKEGDYSDTY